MGLPELQIIFSAVPFLMKKGSQTNNTGLFFYFFGLHIFTLARIANNTDSGINTTNNSNSREVQSTEPSATEVNTQNYDELLKIGAISKEEYDILTSGGNN